MFSCILLREDLRLNFFRDRIPPSDSLKLAVCRYCSLDSSVIVLPFASSSAFPRISGQASMSEGYCRKDTSAKVISVSSASISYRSLSTLLEHKRALFMLKIISRNRRSARQPCVPSLVITILLGPPVYGGSPFSGPAIYVSRAGSLLSGASTLLSSIAFGKTPNKSSALTWLTSVHILLRNFAS